MRGALLIVIVCATTARAEAPLRVGVSQLQGVNVPADALGFYAEHLAQNLAAPGLTVVTAREIATILGMERQRQMLGCETSSECVAELANALGVDAIVVGDVARFGDTYQINVKALAAVNAKVLASGSARVQGDVATLDAVAGLGRQLARELFRAKGRAVPVELSGAAATPSASGRPWKWVTLGVAGASAIAGAVLYGLARADFEALTGSGAPLSLASAAEVRDAGASKQTASAVLAAVAVLSLAGSLWLFAVDGSGETRVSLVPGPDGVVAVVGGRW